jgi:hypothetical protein
MCSVDTSGSMLCAHIRDDVVAKLLHRGVFEKLVFGILLLARSPCGAGK